jgi:flagellar motor switch protein FliM
MLQVAGPNEIVIMIVFEMRIGATRGMINLCIPASIIEIMVGSFAQAWHAHRREPTVNERAWLHENLSRAPQLITATLEALVTARELLALEPGDVVTLGVPVSESIDLRVGGTLKFKGRLAVADGRAAVRLEYRCDGAGAMVAEANV